MDKRLQELKAKLGYEINEALSESEGIAAVIGEIKAAGYDVFLLLEATIGFNKRSEEAGEIDKTQKRRPAKLSTKIKITAEDDDLLKGMHIIMPEDDDPKSSKSGK